MQRWIVALARSTGSDCYDPFDDDFDRAGRLSRLDAAVNPYSPE